MAQILGGKGTLVDVYIAELRNVEVQTDRMRFRRNLERIGEISAYEISRTLGLIEEQVNTPLGVANVHNLPDQPVLATILRAGLPLHQGLLNYFDKADNAFISAYRLPHSADGSFDVKVEYMSSPSIEGRVVILSDPMLATGSSILLAHQALLRRGTPRHVHVVTAIASTEGLAHVQKHLPGNTSVWVAALDEELTAHAYIVPGLGDAGDLAFGTKE